MISKRTVNVFDREWDASHFAIAIMLILSALTGLINQTLLSLGIVFCCVMLFLCNKLTHALPFMIFYYSFYGLVFGVSVFRIYTLLVIGNAILRSKLAEKIKTRDMLILVIFVLYLVTAMIPAVGISSSLFILFDIITTMILANDLTKNADTKLAGVFKIYVGACITSFLTGFIAGNTIGGEYSYSRFMATFEDPNYMGFFFTLAIFALITLKLFDKRLRIALVITLYIMILTSLSITAIVVNMMLWVIYLVVMKKLRWWSIPIVAAVVILVLGLYNYALNNPSTPIIGDLAARVSEKLASLSAGDVGTVTTGRTDLASMHFSYYLDLPFLNILFGGVPSNTRYIHPELKIGGHNEYVDMLLNIGFIGTAIMMVLLFIRFKSHLDHYKESKKVEDLFFIIGKSIWMIYALTLTMFLDYRFLFVFLL